MLRYIFGPEWRRSGFCAQDMESTGKGINGGDWAESGQMQGCCGIVQRNGGKASPRRAKIKIFRKHGVRGKNGL